MAVPRDRFDRRGVWQMAVVGVTALAVALRSYHLGAHSLWYDETFSAWAAAQDAKAILWISLQDTVHPPLYYLLLSYWTRLLGQSEFALRFLSAGMSALGVPLLFQMGQRGWDKRVGLAAAILWACSPFAVWYGQEARMYAILTIIGLAAMTCLGRALTERSGICVVVVAVLNLVGLYTHYFYVFVVFGQYLYLALTLRRHRRMFWIWVAANALSAALFTPWVVAILRGGLERAQIGWISPLSFQALGETWWQLSTRPRQPLAALALVATLTLGCGLVTTLVQSRRGRPVVTRGLVGMYLLAPVAMVLLISLRRPLFNPRFLQIVLPAYLLICAAGLAQILRPLPGSLLLLGLVLAWLPGLHSMYQMPTRHDQDWPAAMAYLASQAEPGDSVAFRGGQGWHAYWYYYDGTPLSELNLLPGDGIDEFAAKLATSNRGWLITWDTGRSCATPTELIPHSGDSLRITTAACFPEVVVTSYLWQEPG